MKLSVPALANLVVAAMLLLTPFLVGLTSSAPYDPWYDLDDNGQIDMRDIGALARAFGTMGDPTKNVNVTNWPVERELFPENLKLQVGWFSPGLLTVNWRRDLIDETTYRPPMQEPQLPYVENASDWIDSNTTSLLFNETYVYQKIPLEPYRILGFPAISIPINVTVDRSASLELRFQAYLGIVSMAGEWFELMPLGNDTWIGGPYYMWYVQYPTNIIITNTAQNMQPIDISIEPYWRLAIRLLIYGHVNPPVSDNIAYVTATILYHSNGRDLVVDIPIVRSP